MQDVVLDRGLLEQRARRGHRGTEAFEERVRGLRVDEPQTERAREREERRGTSLAGCAGRARILVVRREQERAAGPPHRASVRERDGDGTESVEHARLAAVRRKDRVDLPPAARAHARGKLVEHVGQVTGLHAQRARDREEG
ncbi:hypothetical protein D3C74_397760 [compost metagenome]